MKIHKKGVCMIITLSNQKGGVGKTATAVHLAHSLANSGYKTLLLDCDPQANSGEHLNFFRGEGLDKALIEESISPYIKETQYKNLSIVEAGPDLAETEERFFSKVFREKILYNTIYNEINNLDFIICDTNPSLGILTNNALYAADWIITPCSMDVFSISGFELLFSRIFELKGSSFKNISILQTQKDLRAKMTNLKMEEFLGEYSEFMLESYIRRSEAINQCRVLGMSVFEFDKNAAGSKDYNAFTQELLNVIQK
ncbi:MAG: ParA family protein [Nanobdellota archaeon]